MRHFLLFVGLLLFFPPAVNADVDTIVKEMHDRQMIISGQKQGSVELARRELRELMQKYAREESNQQLGKALEWLESQASGQGFQTDVESLYNGFNRYAGRTSVVPLEMSFVKLAAITEKYGAANTAIKEYGDHAKRGYSYAKRLYELSGVFEENQEPAAKRLSGNLGMLADIMSNYGDKIPVIGAFIAAYGNITGEMLKAVDKLGERLNARNPWLNDATYGSNELTRAYRNQFPGDVWLKPVLGLRDCYVSDSGGLPRVYIFDPKSRHRDRSKGIEYDGAFVPVNFYPPFDAMSSSQTIRELRRRYMMFDNAGVKNPGVRQVLREAGRIVRIEPLIDHSTIQAGQGFPVQILAYYAVDGLPVPRSINLGLVLSQDEGFWGTETQTARTGQFLTWKAPETPGRYQLSVDLTDETKAEGWHLHQAKAVKTPYIVGAPTHLSLTPARAALATTGRQPVAIAVKLHDEAGKSFRSGDLLFEVTPQGPFGMQIPGSYLDPRPRLEISGTELKSDFRVLLVPEETAVIEPGLVRITARYTDSDKRIASAMATLRVQEPRIVEGSHIMVKTRKRGQEFDFSITVSDEKERKVRVGTVKVTALAGGLFKTFRGAEQAAELNLSKPGFVTWVPGKEGTMGKRFRLEFSGGAWEDALYQPVTTEWTLAPAPEETAGGLFLAATPPVAPPALPLPADTPPGTATAESGYRDRVDTAQWEQIQAGELPPAQTKTQASGGNLFAGDQPPASQPETGNLFAGVGKGLGVTPKKPDVTPAKPEASLFAGIGIPAQKKPPTPVQDTAQNTPPNPSTREWVIQSVKLTNDSGVAVVFSPGQVARVYLTTQWSQQFLERVRLIIRIDQQTVFDDIHEFRDRMGTYKTDFFKVIQIPASLSSGQHTLTVTGELAKAAPNLTFTCRPQSIAMAVKAPESSTGKAASLPQESGLSSPAPASASAFAKKLGLPDRLMAAPGFAQALETALQQDKTSRATGDKNGWIIGLTFNNNPKDQFKAMYVQRRMDASPNKPAAIYRLSYGEIEGKWQKSFEEFLDPSGNGNFWYKYEGMVNRAYRHEYTGDGSGPNPTRIKTWYIPSGRLLKDYNVDPFTGKELEKKNYDINTGKLVGHMTSFPDGGYELTAWRSCGHLASRRAVSGGKKTQETGPPCKCPQ